MKLFAQHQDNTAELLIYDTVGQDWFGESVTASTFKAELDALGAVERIRVRINSEGGDVFDGFTIHNLLADHQAEVEVIVDGLAASIASVVAMAGDTIAMAAGSMMMIHNPWSIVAGDAVEFRRMAGVLDKLQGNIADIYAQRSGQDRAALLSMMADESWLTADEAVEVGLADSVAQTMAVAARVRPDRFHNPPEHLLASASPPPAAAARRPTGTRERELILTRARAGI